jgi:hypothetical protein
MSSQDDRELIDGAEEPQTEYLRSREVPGSQRTLRQGLDRRLVLCVYPVVLLLGQLVHIGRPEPTYFSNSRNIFNQIFVKKGWLWTTIAFLILLGDTAYVNASKRQKSPAHCIGQAFVRYFAATAWWIVFAQWLFGLPIMDRVFILTGGSCEGVTSISNITSVSSAYCRANGGIWTGGYDPSGHMFLLVHSSLFLWLEILPHLRDRKAPLSIAVKLVVGLLALWGWMLLMTAVYFHSFPEKVVGLACGYVEVGVVLALASYTRVGEQIFGQVA